VKKLVIARSSASCRTSSIAGEPTDGRCSVLMKPTHSSVWRRLCWLPALVGCGATPPSTTIPASTESATGAVAPVAGVAPEERDRAGLLDLLSDEPDEPRRVSLARSGAVRFAMDGAVIAEGDDEAEAGTEHVVADEGASRIRIVSDVADGVRLLVWIERGDAALSIVEATGVASDPGGQTPRPGEPGLFLDPGAPVGLGAAEGRAQRVSLDGDIVAAGWVPVSAVGHVFVPADGEADGGASDEDEAMPALQGEVREEPAADGRALAYVELLFARLIGPEVDDWQEIEVEGWRTRVRGFVRARELQYSGGFGYGRGKMFGIVPSETTLPADSCLFAGPGDALIGKTVADLTTSATARGEGGWERFSVGSAWGPVDAWAHRTDGGAGWEACP
jgi:hypothetical protein